jgi:hypothetical protein
MITLQNLVDAAADLASHGDNSEYDRALVELVATFMPGDRDNAKDYVSTLILRSV